MAVAATDNLKSGVMASGDANDWIETLARFGYAAKGVVYMLIGGLAFQLAVGQGGEAVGPRGAIDNIAGGIIGKVILGLIALGLFGYSIWRFVQAAKDPENKGDDAKGIATRIGYACSGLVYALVGVEAVRLIFTAGGGGGGDDGAAHWTAKVMEWPFGRWLVGAVALGILGAGLYQLYRGYSAEFKKLLKSEEMSADELKWGERLGRAGFAARGVVYLLIGGFLLYAAIQSNPQQAKGIGGALNVLRETSYGPWVLAIVAAGLFAYGAFSAGILARYRRILGS